LASPRASAREPTAGRRTMASYVIAGKADDPAFARAEFAAKQIEAACPNVYFQYEMKHPDAWKDFILSVFRQYDFHGFNDEFGGPLVWTHEGELVGNGAEFVQKICIEKFGMQDPPSLTDPLFRAIAADNLKTVRLARHRQEHGPPFAEKCEAACVRAQEAGLVEPEMFEEKRRTLTCGASLEVWVAGAVQGATSRDRVKIDLGLQVGNVGGYEGTHIVALHPRPLARKQLVLLPQRLVQEVDASPRRGALTSAGSSELQDPFSPEGSSNAEVVGRSPVAAAGPETGRALEVPIRDFRGEPKEDLGLMDFTAAMEVLNGVGGVATWMGLRAGAEFRQPLDTHLQVLSYPLHSQGEDCPLRYPLELLFESALRDGVQQLKVFPFKHSFSALPIREGTPEEKRKQPNVLGQAAFDAYEAAKATFGEGSCSIAFTTSWFAMLPLEPPAEGSAPGEAWLQLPPPHPVALCGIVVAPSLQRGFPETAGLEVGSSTGKLVSTRALEEGIPEGTPEFEAASREVRIAARILGCPAELMGVWAKV